MSHGTFTDPGGHCPRGSAGVEAYWHGLCSSPGGRGGTDREDRRLAWHPVAEHVLFLSLSSTGPLPLRAVWARLSEAFAHTS
jgi:hypothetical protein